MGFFSRISKPLTSTKGKRKRQLKKDKRIARGDPDETCNDSIVQSSSLRGDPDETCIAPEEDCESEIDVDNVHERADYKDLSAVWDGSHFDFKAGCDNRTSSSSSIPSTIEFFEGDDNVSTVSLHSLSS